MDYFYVARGVCFPFRPLKPMYGRMMVRRAIAGIIDMLKDRRWIAQPALAGERAILAVHKGAVLVFDAELNDITRSVHNAPAFRKLGNGHCFDGVVQEGGFHPFECVAFQGRSLITSTTDERQVMAYSLVKFLAQPWLFSEPTETFMQKLGKNGPKWGGVVLKRDRSVYRMAAKPGETNVDWTLRPWTSRSMVHVTARRAVGKNAGA